MPLPLRTVLSPPHMDLDTLGRFTREELHPDQDTPLRKPYMPALRGYAM